MQTISMACFQVKAGPTSLDRGNCPSMLRVLGLVLKVAWQFRVIFPRRCILGKFLDHTDFQSWRVNFRTEVCSKAKNPRLALQWVKEIETAKSLDDLITPKSITVKNFTDFEELDLMMAAALKK